MISMTPSTIQIKKIPANFWHFHNTDPTHMVWWRYIWRLERSSRSHWWCYFCWWLNHVDHVELRNLNIWLRASDSAAAACWCWGSLKKWFWRPGNERGKERDKESRGWAGAGGVASGGRGSNPQNCDVILLRARWAGWWGVVGPPEPVREEKAGWAGQPG